MHGGSISVTSEPGEGSCFTVSIPWQPNFPEEALSSSEMASPAVHPMENIGIAAPRTILLAEDNENNIMTIGDYLEAKGHRLVYARNGWEALKKAAECSPDLILMDIQMPEMDGLEATRRLRADHRFAATPIVALTALAMEGDRERCLDAGASNYLSKPVRLKDLTDLIHEILESGAA
jgi:CheY-like chemotaxis protein